VLFAANHDDHTIVPFRIDQQSGRLAATGEPTIMPTPVCVQFGAAAP
jgi:6-phosphogluconolactonase (cycloisomerase 2 family)